MNTSSAIIARLDRLPPSGPVWNAVTRISFGAFFEIYETALTGLLSVALIGAGVFRKDAMGLFGLPDLATFAFATFAGLFVGALLFSSMADRYGRRPIFIWSVVWYAFATLLMVFQTDASVLCMLRFVSAIGVGANIVTVDAYLAEMVPRSMRGRGFAISKSIQYLAVPVAGGVAAALAHRSPFGIEGWRFLLIVPVLGAPVVVWLSRGLPESPRWLATHGKTDEAQAIVERFEGACIAQGIVLAEPISSEPLLHVEGKFSELLRPPLLGRSLMMIVASCAGGIAYFGFSNWLPSLLELQHVTITKSLLYVALIGFSYPLAPLAFSLFADKFERKWQICAGAVVTAGAGLAFAMQSSPVGWILTGLLITVGNNLSSYATHTYRSELFPTRLRSRAIGLVYSIDRLAAAFSSYLIGFLLIQGGVPWVLGCVVGFSAINAVTIGVFGPRTRSGYPSATAVPHAV